MDTIYKVGDIVRVSFVEGEKNFRRTPYKAKILEIETKENSFFNEFKIEILSRDTTAPTSFNTKGFEKNVGDIFDVKDFYISDL